MDGRTLPIESLADFIYLLKITPAHDRLGLLSQYSDKLSALIHSIDDIFAIYSNVDSELKEKITKEYAHLFKGAFRTPENIAEFLKRDKDYFFYQLIKPASPLTAHLISLFNEPAAVLMLLEENCSAAEHLFQHHIPAASGLVFSKQSHHLSELSTRIYHRAAIIACDELVKRESLDVKAFIDLGFLHKCHQYDETTSQHILKQFERLLTAEQHRAVVSSLAQKENFEKLFYSAPYCVYIFLQHHSLIDIFFGGKLTLKGLSTFIKNDRHLTDKLFDRHPAEIAGLFKTTADVRSFCEAGYSSYVYTLPEAQLKIVGALFSSSRYIDDWLWLARQETNKRNFQHQGTGHTIIHSKNSFFGLTMFAAAALREYPFKQEPGDQSKIAVLTAILSNTENLISLAKACPGFLDMALKKVEIDKTLFEDPEVFWRFLNAGGMSWLLSDFTLSIIYLFPTHLQFIFERSDHFRTLDKEFTERLIDTFRKAIFALLKASNNITWVLENFPKVLGDHDIGRHPEKWFRLAKTAPDLIAIIVNLRNYLNNEKFAEYYRREQKETFEKYIRSEACQIPALLRSFPDSCATLVKLTEVYPLVARLLIAAHTEKMLAMATDLKDVLQMLQAARFQTHFDWALKPFCEAFKRNPAAFAKLYVVGKQEDKIFTIFNFPALTNILFELAPEIMIQAFCGVEFVALLKNAPIAAARLLNQFKYQVTTLIPTQDMLAEVNRENPMLMRQFAYQWPHLATTTFQASLANNRYSLLALPNSTISNMDMDVDMPDAEESAAQNGMF